MVKIYTGSIGLKYTRTGLKDASSVVKMYLYVVKIYLEKLSKVATMSAFRSRLLSHRVEGLPEGVLEPFFFARAKQQRSAVDVCNKTKSLRERPSPHALIVLVHGDGTTPPE